MLTSQQVQARESAVEASSAPELSAWSVSERKRIFDFLTACVLIALASPLMAVIAILVKLTSPGPALFRQVRVGKHTAHFKLLKFRTMRIAQGPAITRKGDARITALGKMLRRTKLDELPQLINVIRGEMSLVGPRPDLPEFYSTLTGASRRILDLSPGLTGCASLYYSDEESVLSAVPEESVMEYYISSLLPEKVRLDLKYACQATFLTDLRLLLATIAKLYR